MGIKNSLTCFYSNEPSQKLSLQKRLLNHSETLSRPRSLTENVFFLALVSEDSAEFIKGWSWRRSVTTVCLCSLVHKDIFQFLWKEPQHCPVRGEKTTCDRHYQDAPHTPAIAMLHDWCIFHLCVKLCFTRQHCWITYHITYGSVN